MLLLTLMISNICPAAEASDWPAYRDALVELAAGSPVSDSPPAKPLYWQTAERAIEGRVATCAQLTANSFGPQDEFESHECDSRLSDLRAGASSLLAAGAWFTSTIDVLLGEYDFAAHTFPLLTRPIPMIPIEPSLCPGAVGGSDTLCVFAAAPRRASIVATLYLGAGMYPKAQKRTQFAGAWAPQSEAFADDVAQIARKMLEPSGYRADVVFRWALAADNCVAATASVPGYCWGAEPASIRVQWPWAVREALAKGSAATP